MHNADWHTAQRGQCKRRRAGDARTCSALASQPCFISTFANSSIAFGVEPAIEAASTSMTWFASARSWLLAS